MDNYNCGGCITGFEGYVRELKIWDTFRFESIIKKSSVVNFSDKYINGIIGYWKFNYELGSLGNQIYDFSNNENIPIDVSDISKYSWETPGEVLVLCDSN